MENLAKRNLSNNFAEMGLTNRIIDEVSVTPDLPEEYGFILPKSRFRPQLTSRNMPRFMELCKKVQFISHPDKPLLLKNPWDFLNFSKVKQALPKARFIFLHRNPIDVINSQIKAVRSLSKSENKYTSLLADWYNRRLDRILIGVLFSPHFGLGFKIVQRHVALAAKYFLQNVKYLKASDYICVKYEDLCKVPDLTISKILEFLSISISIDFNYSYFIKKRPRKLLGEVVKNKDKTLKRLKNYIIYCGYELANY
jgi:hypothetical protein